MDSSDPDYTLSHAARMKVMIVGQENVGKTSLVRALKQFQRKKREGIFTKTRKRATSTTKRELGSSVPNFQVSGDTLSTDGIVIEDLVFNDGKTFTFWDFGGQEVYYTTHSFFLSERSIYLLVFNITEDLVTSKMEYWLNTIQVHAPNSPILLVATHLDKKKGKAQEILELMDSIRKPIVKKFKQVKDAFAVSTHTTRGVEELKITMIELASKDPCMQTAIPTKILVLERYLVDVERVRYQLKKQVPVISWKEFVEKASVVNIGKTGSEDERLLEVTEAAELLHVLGSILYFHNGEEELVIIDPDWIIQLFKTLFTTKHVFVKDGLIPFSAIRDHIWKEAGSSSEFHNSLLDVFEAFEVMFRLTDDMKNLMAINNKEEQMLLVPSLLPTTKPSDVLGLWWGIGVLLYSRHYKFEFIPHGLFNRVIFRLMKYTLALRYWRYGVLIKHKKDDSHALVELKPDYNIITIEVRGSGSTPESSDFFCHIVELLEFLLNHAFSLSADVTYIDPASNCKFGREELEEHSLKGEWVLKSGDFKIRLDVVAPDLALTGLSHNEIKNFASEVQVGELLGEGSFAQVYKGTYKDELVAIKRLNMHSVESSDQARAIFNEFRKEVITMSMLNHPNVVNLLGFSVETPFSMVMEFVGCGTLYDFVSDGKGKLLDWNFRLRVAYDIASAMAFLHSVEPPLIHRDMKSPNVLLASTDYKALQVAKVSDFGISNKLYAQFKATKARDRDVVNPTWLAPEIVREEVSGAPSDVYPFGIMLWELITGEHPYAELGLRFSSQIEGKIKTGVRPTIPQDCPQIYTKLVCDCWDGLPQNRPTFDAIVNTRLPSVISTVAPDLVQVLSHVRAELQTTNEKIREKRMTLVLNKLTTAAPGHHRLTMRRPEVLTSFSTVYEQIQNNWNNLQQELQQLIEPKARPVAKENFLRFLQDPETETSNKKLKRSGTVIAKTPISSTTVTPSNSPPSAGMLMTDGTDAPSSSPNVGQPLPEQQQQQPILKSRFPERSVSVSVSSSIAHRVKAFQNALSVSAPIRTRGPGLPTLLESTNNSNNSPEIARKPLPRGVLQTAQSTTFSPRTTTSPQLTVSLKSPSISNRQQPSPPRPLGSLLPSPGQPPARPTAPLPAATLKIRSRSEPENSLPTSASAPLLNVFALREPPTSPLMLPPPVSAPPPLPPTVVPSSVPPMSQWSVPLRDPPVDVPPSPPPLLMPMPLPPSSAPPPLPLDTSLPPVSHTLQRSKSSGRDVCRW